MADKHFDQLYRGLKDGPLLGAFEVAEACLQYATLCVRDGTVFDSATERALDVRPDIQRRIGGNLTYGFDPTDLKAIAEAIARSDNKPLAAWCTAHLISIAISQKFGAFTETPPEYVLQDLQAFATPAHSCAILYGGTHGLSAEAGPERRQNDPSFVGGLALWRKDRGHPFSVVVDNVGGAEFNRCLDDKDSLRIGLVQPNRELDELCIEELSPTSDTDHRFYGVHPRDDGAQVARTTAGLKHAADAAVGIALLPELVMTAELADTISAILKTPGKVIPKVADARTMRVVVTGSFHHVDDDGIRRNSTEIHFPRADPATYRRHSKSGDFFLKAPRAVLEQLSCDPKVARAAKRSVANGKSAKGNVKFREDVVPTYEIRLFSGAKFSAVVVICADLLNFDFRGVLRLLAPSLVLVCNMNEKSAEFVGAAHDLIGACQTTMVAVNNPAQWWGSRVHGALVGMPLGPEEERIKRQHFADTDSCIVVDVMGKTLSKHPQ